MTVGDGDLRMLGAADGYAHGLIRVRQEINSIAGHYSPAIHPRHTKKLAARAAKLKPLKDLEAWLQARHDETLDAYHKTRSAHGEGMTEKPK